MPFGHETRGSIENFHHEYTEGGAAQVLGKLRTPPFQDLESEECKAWLRGYDDMANRKHNNHLKD